MQWTKPEAEGPDSDHSQILRLLFDGRVVFFRASYELTPSRGLLKHTHLLVEPGKGIEGSHDNPINLIVSVRLTQRTIAQCKEYGLSAIDLNGRAWLRASGLLVERAALPGRDYRVHSEPRNIFTGKSERIVRSLLSDVTRTWRQKELVSRTDASSGLISRVVRHLLQEGYLSEVEKKRYLVEDWSALLDDWSEQDSLRDRVSTYRYSTLGGTPLEWSQKLTNLCGEHSIRIAFTQWIAGWLRTPYTEPVVTSAYVDRPPDPSLLDKLQLREVPDAGKIWLHVPEDEGVFRETRTVQGLPLVTDAQIYVDLQDTGLRGPDQAAALRTWEGFCRP